MKLMRMDKRKFVSCAKMHGIDEDEKVSFKEDCILALRFIRSMQCQFLHYWDEDIQLCNGELMGDVKSGMFPIIQSAKLRSLLNNTRLKYLIEWGILERKKIIFKKGSLKNKHNKYLKYYYIFTPYGESLFNGDWTAIKKDEAKYIDQCIDYKLPLLYRQVRDNLKQFKYRLPEKYIVLPEIRKRIWRKHRDSKTTVTDERIDELAEMFYQYAQSHSEMDESLLKYTVSSDEIKWGGRIYSHYSQIQRYLRNFIVLKDNPSDTLIQLDFKTFQMHALVYAMKKDFGMKDLGLFEKHLQNKFDRHDVYRTLAIFYYIRDVTDDERNDTKGKIFKLVFGRIKESDSFWEILKSIYPEFADGLRKIKTIPKTEFQKRMVIKQEDYYFNCHKQAPFMGSFYEVKFFKTIWRYLIKNKIPFIPIHDAVLVPKSFVDEFNIESYMQDESTKFFKYPLMLDVKEMKAA